MHSLAQIRAKFLLALDGTSEGQFPSFLVICGLFCSELVMNDLEGTRFLYGSVDGATVGTIHRLSSYCVDPLCKGLASQVLEVGTSEASEVLPPVFLAEQNFCTCLKEGGRIVGSANNVVGEPCICTEGLILYA